MKNALILSYRLLAGAIKSILGFGKELTILGILVVADFLPPWK